MNVIPKGNFTENIASKVDFILLYERALHQRHTGFIILFIIANVV